MIVCQKCKVDKDPFDFPESIIKGRLSPYCGNCELSLMQLPAKTSPDYEAFSRIKEDLKEKLRVRQHYKRNGVTL